jgi:hypothetical protein
MPGRPRFRRIRWIVPIVLAYAIVMTFGGCADRLIFPADTHPRPDSSERRLVSYADDGAQMEVFVARSPGAASAPPRAFVLRFTGDAAGAAAFTASRWGDRAVEVWVVNYPGFGNSTGPRSMRRLAREALAAFDALKIKAGDRPIFVEGVSLGTVPALCVMARRDVAGGILQNPPPLRQLILGSHGWWNLWLIAGPVALQVPHEFDSIANARQSKMPTTFLVADHDGTVQPRYQHKIIDAYAAQMASSCNKARITTSRYHRRKKRNCMQRWIG